MKTEDLIPTYRRNKENENFKFEYASGRRNSKTRNQKRKISIKIGIGYAKEKKGWERFEHKKKEQGNGRCIKETNESSRTTRSYNSGEES